MLNGLNLLQEEPETSYYKPETHQRQAGANQGQQSPLRRQVIGQAGL
jgi:hypothetical protein